MLGNNCQSSLVAATIAGKYWYSTIRRTLWRRKNLPAYMFPSAVPMKSYTS